MPTSCGQYFFQTLFFNQKLDIDICEIGLEVKKCSVQCSFAFSGAVDSIHNLIKRSQRNISRFNFFNAQFLHKIPNFDSRIFQRFY